MAESGGSGLPGRDGDHGIAPPAIAGGRWRAQVDPALVREAAIHPTTRLPIIVRRTTPNPLRPSTSCGDSGHHHSRAPSDRLVLGRLPARQLSALTASPAVSSVYGDARIGMSEYDGGGTAEEDGTAAGRAAAAASPSGAGSSGSAIGTNEGSTAPGSPLRCSTPASARCRIWAATASWQGGLHPRPQRLRSIRSRHAHGGTDRR